ncbi:hypothetical protein CVT24_000711 [Panaeolus cyanescens]|uniref:Uncharacterized protein n=1 Tax=Panaeolus cyanescens TaxID=181874 RepID=A0A409YT30_9AGAR|nr:hypothetical protein CVT24_000711 [Panaeolus cyanescens]
MNSSVIQVCRKVFLGHLIATSAFAGLLLTIALNITQDESWYSVDNRSTRHVMFIFGLGLSALTIVSLALLIAREFKMTEELLVMHIFWVLWMIQTVLVTKYRGSGDDQRLYYCHPSEGSYCQVIFAIQGVVITLFVVGLLYVLVLLIYCAISRHSPGQDKHNWADHMRNFWMPQTSLDQYPPWWIPCPPLHSSNQPIRLLSDPKQSESGSLEGSDEPQVVYVHVPVPVPVGATFDPSVGKSALTIRFVQNIFVKNYDPTIEDEFTKLCDIDGQTITVLIADTASQEYYYISRAYIHGAGGFLLVYSVASRHTFETAQHFHWLITDTLKRTAGSKLPSFILVGNKADSDSNREVMTDEGQAFARGAGCGFVETSALNDTNVEKPFHDLLRLMLNEEKAPADGHVGSASPVPK